MRYLLIFLLGAAGVMAADSQGVGRNPLRTTALDDTISVSFFTKEKDDTLYFRLSWKKGENSSSSLSSGSGVLPGKGYAYYWDDGKKIFWFADERFLLRCDMSKAREGHTDTMSSPTGAYKGEKDLPAGMAASIEALLREK